MLQRTVLDTSSPIDVLTDLLQLLDAGCPTPSTRTWIFVALFSAGLVVTLAGALWAGAEWRRRIRESTDTAQRVARNSAVPLALQMITRAMDFAFVALLFRFECLSAIGNYEFAALVVVLYLGSLADFGLTTLITRDAARDESRMPLLFRTMVRMRVWLGVASLVFAAAVPLFYYAIGEPLATQTVLLIAILALTLLPSGYAAAATAVFNAAERMIVPAWLNLLVNVASALLRVGAIVAGLGMVGVATAALIATVGSALLFAVALRRSFGALPLRGPTLPWPPLLREGWPLMLNSLLLSVFFRFDAFIIEPALGSAALALYNVSYKYINLTQILPPIVVTALFPLLSRRAGSDQAAFLHAYRTTLRLLVLLAVPLTVLMSVLAEPIAVLVADQEGPASAPILAVIIWYLPFSYINGLTQYALIAQGRQRAITAAFGITALFNLSANLLLTPRYGLLAAAALTVASELVLYLPLARSLKQAAGPTSIVGLFWQPALAGAALAGTLLLFGGRWPLLAAPAGLLVYLGALALLRTFTEEDRTLLRRVLSRTS